MQTNNINSGRKNLILSWYFIAAEGIVTLLQLDNDEDIKSGWMNLLAYCMLGSSLVFSILPFSIYGPSRLGLLFQIIVSSNLIYLALGFIAHKLTK